MQAISPLGAHLVFDVADRPCAVALERVAEVLPMTALTRPPGAPPMLAGFFVMGGRAVAVLRLARLFDLPEDPPGLFTPLIVLRGEPTPTAWLATSVRRIVESGACGVEPLPPGHLFADCAIGAFRVDEAAVTVLAPDRVLLKQEQQRLRAFAAMEQRRLSELEEAAA